MIETNEFQDATIERLNLLDYTNYMLSQPEVVGPVIVTCEHEEYGILRFTIETDGSWVARAYSTSGRWKLVRDLSQKWRIRPGSTLDTFSPEQGAVDPQNLVLRANMDAIAEIIFDNAQPTDSGELSLLHNAPIYHIYKNELNPLGYEWIIYTEEEY